MFDLLCSVNSYKKAFLLHASFSKQGFNQTHTHTLYIYNVFKFTNMLAHATTLPHFSGTLPTRTTSTQTHTHASSYHIGFSNISSPRIRRRMTSHTLTDTRAQRHARKHTHTHTHRTQAYVCTHTHTHRNTHTHMHTSTAIHHRHA